MRCVLLHGFTGAPSAWDETIAEGRWTDPIAIALPGHGGGPVRAAWDDNLAAVAAAIARAGGADLPLVGYSLGARVALGLIATARAPRAILIGVHPGLADPAERAARRAADAAWIDRLSAGDLAGFAAAWEAQPILAAPRASPAARARRAAIRRGHDPGGLAASLAHMGLAAMPDYRDQVRAHAAALHLIVGADDAKFLPLAGALAAAAPGLGLDVVTSGHDPTLEAPAELAAVVARALAR